jgi:protein-L-isoaspartate(D-aspartate) O-methyltransferase
MAAATELPGGPRRRRGGAAAVALALCCGGGLAVSAPPDRAALDGPRQELRRERERMVAEQIRARGVVDRQVLAVMAEVPRHLFVPAAERAAAYEDHPLPIGFGQTISQPYIVALMTSLLALQPGARVLEIGTGSGYQAAVLSRLAGSVYSIEILPELGARARDALDRLGYRNVQVRIADGYRGWPEAAPFDAIVITAAPPAVPAPLVAQLKPGGRMVLPVGGVEQKLLLHKAADGSVEQQQVLPVRFVPMTGEAQAPPP